MHIENASFILKSALFCDSKLFSNVDGDRIVSASAFIHVLDYDNEYGNFLDAFET